MPKPAAKRSKVKSPFALHPTLTPRSNPVTARARALALSPDGAHLLVVDDGRARFFDTRTGEPALQGTALDGREVEHVAWSPRGDAVALLRRGDRSANVTLGDFPSGAVRHEVALEEFGTFSHGHPGVTAAVMAFGEDGSTLWARSVPDISRRDSFVWRVDGAGGAAACARLPLGDLVEAIAPLDGDRLVAVAGHRGPDTLVVWRFGDEAPLASDDEVWGLDLALAGGRVWVAGDDRWAFSVDPAGLLAGRLGEPSPKRLALEHKRGQPARDARVEALASRARGKWYQQHFQWRRDVEASKAEDERRSESPRSRPGARAWLHEEPNGVPQCARLGRAALVRDGVTLSAWWEDDGAFRELRLVEDLLKCAPSGSRMVDVAAAGGVVAVAWDKSLGGGTALVHVMEVDLAALGLAA
ncbi:MAG: hypothetical protein U0324_26900 [Polyangiales bacterium]